MIHQLHTSRQTRIIPTGTVDVIFAVIAMPFFFAIGLAFAFDSWSYGRAPWLFASWFAVLPLVDLTASFALCALRANLDEPLWWTQARQSNFERTPFLLVVAAILMFSQSAGIAAELWEWVIWAPVLLVSSLIISEAVDAIGHAVSSRLGKQWRAR